jgi:hypothetical protein
MGGWVQGREISGTYGSRAGKKIQVVNGAFVAFPLLAVAVIAYGLYRADAQEERERIELRNPHQGAGGEVSVTTGSVSACAAHPAELLRTQALETLAGSGYAARSPQRTATQLCCCFYYAFRWRSLW